MVQALQTAGTDTASARLSDGALLLDGFVEDDPVVVAALGEVEDLVGAVHAHLQLGARVAQMSRATIDTLVVEQRFEALSAAFGEVMDDAANRIAGTTDRLVDDDGALPAMLRSLKTDLEAQLGGLFDEQSKTSALALFEKVFAKVAAEHLVSMRRSLDPADATSPFGQWKHEVVTSVREQVGLLLQMLTQVSDSIAADRARDDTFKLTAVKGASFEARLHELLGRIASRYGDLAEHVGTTSGTAGRRTGDEVVSVNPDETPGQRLAVVFEAKDRKLPMRKTLEELDRAGRNRDAQAAVAVFASPELAPTAVPFTCWGNLGIVVLEGGPLDEKVLELAYVWARLEAKKALASTDTTLDVEAVTGALAQIRRAVDRVSIMRRNHSAARNQINQAANQLDEMVSDIDDALGELHRLIGT